MRSSAVVASFVSVSIVCGLSDAAQKRVRLSREEKVKTVLEQAKPLEHPRGDRLPLFIWRMIDATYGLDDAAAEQTVKDLGDRGVSVISNWQHHPKRREQYMKNALRTAAFQRKLGLPVVTFANPLLHRFFNGDPETAHIDEDGNPFFDMSFSSRVKIGCAFSVKHRYVEIEGRVEDYVKAYKEADMPLDIVFADWEIDGPIEWNEGWAHCKRCKRCRENIKNIEDFTEFQKALRTIRSEMQRVCYAEPIKKAYPNVLVGNYAVNPHDGWRYWYDYFEKEPTEGMDFRMDQRCPVRRWFDEYPLTGFTYANPTVYTWYRTYDWYDFKNPDYRWFYNLLMVATNTCRNTPRETPVIAFVHWHTTAPPKDAKPVPQFSEEKYQELLWHMLLRGTDSFAMWCVDAELAKETRLVHEVYAESLKYREFLDKGEPIGFDVPKTEGPVVSGLRLGNEVLVIRSDFTDDREPVKIKVGQATLEVPRSEGTPEIVRIGG